MPRPVTHRRRAAVAAIALAVAAAVAGSACGDDGGDAAASTTTSSPADASTPPATTVGAIDSPVLTERRARLDGMRTEELPAALALSAFPDLLNDPDGASTYAGYTGVLVVDEDETVTAVLMAEVLPDLQATFQSDLGRYLSQGNLSRTIEGQQVFYTQVDVESGTGYRYIWYDAPVLVIAQGDDAAAVEATIAALVDAEG